MGAELNQRIVEEIVMRKLLFVAAAVAALGVAAPASAQVFIGADQSGAGVQIGPVGAGVGPRFSNDGYYHRRGYHAYAYDRDGCRMVRTRVMRNGHVRYRTRQVCR
jgi:hypothetical protein